MKNHLPDFRNKVVSFSYADAGFGQAIENTH
jgi:hypothetical protein